MSTWRDTAAPIIQRVIAKHRGEPERAIRRALRAAYPFGPRSHYPYRAWCSEVRRQLEELRPASSDVSGLPLFAGCAHVEAGADQNAEGLQS